MSEVLIARQPIFNADRKVAAYELLFRSPGETRARAGSLRGALPAAA
jgi:c-di-GMP-related signal transduction protein